MAMPRRAELAERMDDPALAEPDLRRALSDLDRLGGFLGGRTAALEAALAALPPLSRPARVLDLGCGSGADAAALVDRARRAGRALEVVGVDLHPGTCRLARASVPQVRVVRADARRLPFADGAFDVAMASLVLHHFPRPEDVLAEMRRVAREIVVSDLRRSPLSLAAVWLAARALRCGPVARADGTVSVRRAFRRADVLQWRRLPGLEGLRVRRQEPFRWLAVTAGNGR